MQAMKYSITIAYVPGQDMWFSDTLSRSRYGEEHKPKPNESLSRDVEIHVNMIRENLPVSELKWKEIVDKTIDDETLSEVNTTYVIASENVVQEPGITLTIETSCQFWSVCSSRVTGSLFPRS